MNYDKQGNEMNCGRKLKMEKNQRKCDPLQFIREIDSLIFILYDAICVAVV